MRMNLHAIRGLDFSPGPSRQLPRAPSGTANLCQPIMEWSFINEAHFCHSVGTASTSANDLLYLRISQSSRPFPFPPSGAEAPQKVDHDMAALPVSGFLL